MWPTRTPKKVTDIKRAVEEERSEKVEFEKRLPPDSVKQDRTGLDRIEDDHSMKVEVRHY